MTFDPTETITLSAGPIRYRDVGPKDAPVLLFVHGLLVSGTVWRKVVPALAKAHRCIVPDWPFGSHAVAMNADADLRPEGIARLVAELAEALDLRDVTLVGNDSGGAVCQLVAAHHDARIGRLVLATCDAFEVFPPKLFAYLKLVAKMPALVTLFTRAMLAVPALTRLPIAYGIASKRPVDPDVVAAWLAPAARDAGVRRDVAKFIAGVSPRVTLDVAEELHRFAKPVLLAWATEERSFPITLAERLAARFPDARIVRIDDALVFVQEDAPEALVRAITAFVPRVRASRHAA